MSVSAGFIGPAELTGIPTLRFQLWVVGGESLDMGIEPPDCPVIRPTDHLGYLPVPHEPRTPGVWGTEGANSHEPDSITSGFESTRM